LAALGIQGADDDRHIWQVRTFAPQPRGWLAAAPALTAGTTPAAAQAAPETAAQQLQAAPKNGKGTKLVLLGTGGGPVPGRARHMTLHVMLSDGAAYVLDCGLGVTGQFARTGIPFKRVAINLHHASCEPRMSARGQDRQNSQRA
jgi:hypothetical protein